MTALHERFGQIGNDMFRAAIAQRRNALVQRRTIAIHRSASTVEPWTASRVNSKATGRDSANEPRAAGHEKKPRRPVAGHVGGCGPADHRLSFPIAMSAVSIRNPSASWSVV